MCCSQYIILGLYKMGNKITSFQLKNIQSWGSNIDPLEVSQSGMTVLRARSETGKSVLFKVFRVVCFYGRDRKSRLALIKRGCDSGSLTLWLSNGASVQFEVTKKKVIYRLRESDDSQWRVWDSVSMLPEEIRVQLGWHLDYDNKILLNLITVKNSLFVDSSPKYNASILKCITDNPRMYEIQETASEWIDQINSAINSLQAPMLALQKICDVYTRVDEQALERNIRSAKEIERAWDAVDRCFEQCKYFEAVLRMRPKVLDYDMESAGECYAVLQLLDCAMTGIDRMIDVASAKPDNRFLNIDFDLCENIIEVLSTCNAANNALKHTVGLVERKPQCLDKNLNLNMLESISNVIVQVGKSRGSYINFIRILSSRPIEVPYDIREVGTIYDVSIQILEVEKAFSLFVKTIQRLNIVKKQLYVDRENLKRLESEMKVCPLCGADLRSDIK